jgi:serine/threonine protein kinase
MDYIDGVDLAVYIYDFLLTKLRNFEQDTLENMSFIDKQNHIAEILNLEFPNNDESFKVAIANRDNLKKLVSKLQKINFHIDEEFINKISASIKALEENGIFHNDLHERNIIMGKDGKPYLIDFGRSVQDKDKQTSDDEALVRRLNEINTKKETKENLDEIRKWEKFGDREPLKDEATKFQEFLDTNKSEKIKNYLKAYTTQEKEFDHILALLNFLINKNAKQRKKRLDTVVAIIDSLISEKITPFINNKLKRFRSFIGTN